MKLFCCHFVCLYLIKDPLWEKKLLFNIFNQDLQYFDLLSCQNVINAKIWRLQLLFQCVGRYKINIFISCCCKYQYQIGLISNSRCSILKDSIRSSLKHYIPHNATQLRQHFPRVPKRLIDSKRLHLLLNPPGPACWKCVGTE